MNILITGGSGFIGTNLVDELLKENHQVTIFDKRKSAKYPDLCIVADVRDKEKVTQALREIDVVYHLAAEHRDDVKPASLYYDVNVGGAKNLVYAMKKNSVKKLIFTSSVAVYGLDAGEPNENSSINPFNEYGKSKHESEVVFNAWVKEDHINCLVTVRPTVIFGEGNKGNVYNLISQIASGRFVMVGSGKNKKSMGYVLNLVAFLLRTINFPAGNHIFNYADKPDLSMNELVETTMAALGKGKEKRIRIPYRIGLVGGYFFDLMAKITLNNYSISSIRVKKFCSETTVNVENLKRMNFRAPYSLTDGLDRMIFSDFYKNFETSEVF